MRTRSLVIMLIVMTGLMGVYYANRALQRVIRPRESPQRLFLFFFSNFLLIVVCLISVFALIARLFPR